jgi:dTDP-4-dehydrorhamnose reductase
MITFVILNNSTTMINILVTGSNGQLGSEIQASKTTIEGAHFFYTDVEELDITKSDDVLSYCQDNSINFIINCAAYTAVDKAEDDIEMATLINTTAVANLAQACKVCHAKLIHISTDYVFDGTACEPYRESHATAPQSVYGDTKLKGELVAAEILPETVIIRTSWLYSAFGNNFVKTMKRLGADRESLIVIFDQVGTPTYAADLADAILNIVKQDCKVASIFHFSNEGACSWYDFAHSIMQKSNLNCTPIPVESSEFPTKATRPKYSVLNKKRIKDSYNITIPHWEDALDQCLTRLK